MNNDLEYKIIEATKVTGIDVYQTIESFLNENSDLDAIYQIQANELLSFLRRQYNITEEDSALNCIEEGMKELE